MNSQLPSSGLRMDPGGQGNTAPAPTVVAISSNAIGRGDDELGRVLLRTYLHTLGEVTPRPDTIIFFNSGVTLAVEESHALDDLRALAGQGVRILLCGTCVGHFDLRESVAVGEISNMYAICEAMLRAGKVINL
ncbi:MAG: sulfurtransferase-like selenium metabolism protein YedF [Actinobacteria bacterium]|nr:sulfurtransferase-like selenium metabolism protein YedF [Actinomycetota bacterium]